MQTASKSPIRAVVLDFGEVLSFAPTDADFARMAAVFAVGPAEFKTHYLAARDAYDRGDCTVEGYWAQVAERARTSLSKSALAQVRAWDIEMWGRVNPTLLSWLDELRAAGFMTGVLSNMPSDLGEHFKRHLRWLEHFDHITFSHEIRCAKPEAAVYRHCLQGLNVAPETALFVDDREVNVQAARAVGMVAIRFDSLADFENQLLTIGFPLLPHLAR